MVFDFSLSILYYVHKEKRTGRKVLSLHYCLKCRNNQCFSSIDRHRNFRLRYCVYYGDLVRLLRGVEGLKTFSEFSSYFSVRLKEFQDVFNTPVLGIINIPVPRSYCAAYSINIPDSVDHKKKKMKDNRNDQDFRVRKLQRDGMTDQSYLFESRTSCLSVNLLCCLPFKNQ